MVATTPSDILLAAAEILDRDGWCQGNYFDGDACCLYGAVFRVLGITSLRLDDESYSRVDRILEPVYAIVGTPLLAVWNDTPGRTKEEVIATLRKAAGQMGEVQTGA